ncbi:MAG: RNA polymerase factor sigma-54 [Candidatus Amulumruptor caecigallinarius]|nr:RNA polymerase factor sigma-54 [Candidatus Amulumruptor caecigallinarius]
MSSQNLELTQKTAIRMSQQQLRFVRMLEQNAQELDETVERELDDNPALGVVEETTEEDTRRYPLYAAGNNQRDDYTFTPVDDTESLYDHLTAQLSEQKLSVNEEIMARQIIGSLDTNGYLTRKLLNIADDLAFGQGIEISGAEAEAALKAVQHLDPAGIAATGLKECLELQLIRMPQSVERDNALRIIREAYEAFTKKHKHRIRQQLGMDEAQTDAALELILSLNPKPGASFDSDRAASMNTIVPDFVINVDGGEISITLNNSIPELRIEQTFEQAMKTLERTSKGRPKKGSEYIVTRYNEARDFIKILTHRQETMMRVMSAIVKIQKEYFLTEDVYTLKPMMIKNISDVTGLDISTISRVTSNKYVSLPWGILPLRFFFSDSIGTDTDESEAVTNRKLEAGIKGLIEKEDKGHPLSDREITDILNARGYNLSRRTVAKYRDRQGIPVARLRKSM